MATKPAGKPEVTPKQGQNAAPAGKPAAPQQKPAGKK
jgi:hypothetical protein